jgi:two-component system sensor histidine kinase YesM
MMNDSGAIIVRQEIANSLSSRTELYVDLLDNDLDRTIKLLQEYVNDDDLMKLSTTADILSSAERTNAVLNLKHQMDLLKRSSSMIENAMAFIPLMNRVVESNTNAIADFDAELFDILSAKTNPNSPPLIIWGDRVFIRMPYGYLNQSPLFLLAVEISIKKLSERLNQFTPEGSMAVLMSNEMDWSLSNSGKLNLDKELLAELNMMTLEAVRTINIDNTDFLLANKKSDTIQAQLLMFVPTEQIEGPLKRYRNWVFILFGVAALIVIAFSFSMYRFIHRPLKRLVHSFRQIEQGRFDVSIKYPFNDEFGYLYMRLNAMVKELKKLIQEVYEQQYRARLSELRHLQSQINPHFLYNTFFILYRMGQQEEHESIVRLTKHLGEYFQYITRDDADVVSLTNEVAHARNYTEIQLFRFSNRVDVRFAELPENAEQALVPRLILQPLIENAFKHSLEIKAKGGLLEVDFHIDDSELYIRVEDSGDIDDDTVTLLQSLVNGERDVTATTGLINVHRRLQIHYNGKAELTLDRGQLGGLKVTIRIPLDQEATSHV